MKYIFLLLTLWAQCARSKVRTPNVANFDRKEDSHLIETWLRKRGFVNEQKEEDDSTQPITHQESHDAVSIAAMA